MHIYICRSLKPKSVNKSIIHQQIINESTREIITQIDVEIKLNWHSVQVSMLQQINHVQVIEGIRR